MAEGIIPFACERADDKLHTQNKRQRGNEPAITCFAKVKIKPQTKLDKQRCREHQRVDRKY